MPYPKSFVCHLKMTCFIPLAPPWPWVTKGKESFEGTQSRSLPQAVMRIHLSSFTLLILATAFVCFFVSPVCLQVKISCNTSARHLIFCFHHLAILKGQKQKHECSRKHKRIIDMKLHEIALMKKFQNFRIVVYRRFYAMRKKQRQTSTNISWSQPKTRLVHPGDS